MPVQFGPAIGKLVPGLAQGRPLTECFDVRRPREVTTFDCLTRAGRETGQLALLEARHNPKLRLKGQLLTLQGGERVLFFGSPVVLDLDSLTDLGLTLHDFPVHDGVADFLLLVRSHATTIAEAVALAQRLHRFNSELGQQVGEGTRRLAATHRELERRSAIHEELTSRLQHEIAERERAEADLRLAQKLEAVGHLASGIAHEINTPVQFVGHNLHFLGDAVSDLTRLVQVYQRLAEAVRATSGESTEVLAESTDLAEATDLAFLLEEVPQAVAESLEGIERVSRIIRAMRDFAQPDQGEKCPTNLNQAIEITLVVARNEYRDVADVVTDLDLSLPPVPCIPSELNQVLLNLVVNAAQAISDKVKGTGDRGSIVVRTRQVGEDVEISIADTGTGIPVDLQPRLFDPFFTTRETGRGPGRGLHMSRVIVNKRHGGRLSFTTTPGEGTEFTVHLPLTP